ncbi:hypothetical protein ACA086_11015 [Muriicola sp. E247]|uniref:hypothetical protein n=1 Tax=Muriicola sp. E247 TaxID=3242730 RepID=UPI003524AD18
MEDKYLKSVESIDSIIDTNYIILGGEQGEPRDWELYKFLFHPDGRLIRYEKSLTDGVLRPQFLTVDDYINTTGKWLDSGRKSAFYENEAHKEVHAFGNIAQVFSTYQSFNSKEEMAENKIHARGINSFQLLFDEDRWWILNLFWARETPELPIPDKFLGKL